MAPADRLFRLIGPYIDESGQEQVQLAYDLAAESHAGYTRRDGSPYIDHPTAVACQLAQWHAPPPVLVAGLLHDVNKKAFARPIPAETMQATFAQETVQLVQDIGRLGRWGSSHPSGILDSTQDRMALVTSQLPWVALILQRSPLAVVVKIADKMHNFQSLAVLAPQRQQAFARNVMSIFVPFAERLGMREAKRQLEDHAFAILQPEKCADICRRYPLAARQEAAAPF